MSLYSSSIPLTANVAARGYVQEALLQRVSSAATWESLFSTFSHTFIGSGETERIIRSSSPPVQGEFFKILKEIGIHAQVGRMPDLSVVWDHLSLWGDLPKSFLRHAFARRRSPKLGDKRGKAARFDDTFRVDFSSVKSRMKLHELCFELRYVVVVYHTYWFRTLRPGMRRHVINLLRSNSGLIELQEACNTTDALIASMLLSCPTYPWSYNQTDHIIRSVLSQCLSTRGKFEMGLKTIKKRLRKQLLGEIDSPDISLFSDSDKLLYNKIQSVPDLLSGLNRSHYSPIMPVPITLMGYNKSKLSRALILNFCQTRNTGRAHPRLAQNSIDKFVSVVTTDETELEDKISNYLLGPFMNHIRVESIPRIEVAAKVSATTNACYEAGRMHGGKLRIASDVLIFFDKDPVTRVDLDTGEYTSEPCINSGEKIFYTSVRRFKEAYPHFYSCSLSTILEPGPKVRCVTSSSFYHSQFLQPYSHMTLQALSGIPEVRSGLSKSRHGWIWASELEDPWLFSEKKIYALSTDLETATDYANFRSVADALRFLNEFIGVPKWYGESCIKCLTTGRKIFYKGDLLCVTKRGAPMGDPGTKTFLTLVGLAASYKARRISTLYKSVNIGDDYVGVSSSLLALVRTVQAFSSFDMKWSEDDTYITDSVMYFTEECIEIPRSSYDTVRSVTQSRDYSRMPYIDAIKGRLLIPAKKNRSDFSYTPSGRITQYGKDMSYLKEGQYGALFHLGSIIQDVCLDLTRYRGFVYFPREVSSEGKPIPFNKPENLLRFFASHRSGRYIKKYNYLIDAALTEVDCNIHWRDKIPSKLSSIYTNFNKHAASEAWRISVPRGIPPELADKQIFVGSKFQDSLPGILSRVKRFVISQSEIVGRMAGILLLESMLYDESVDDYTPFDIEHIDIPFDPDCVSESDFRYFISVWQKAPYRFLKLRHEGYYDRAEAEKYLGEFHDFHVYITLHSGHVGNYIERESDPIYRSEFEVQSSRLYEWVKACNAAYRNGTPAPELPPDAVNILSDDELILNTIEDTMRHRDFYVVTTDVQLARQIAIGRVYHGGNGFRTFRIPTREWIMSGHLAEKRFRQDGGLRSLKADGPDCNVWVDTGSFNFQWENIRAEFLGSAHDGSDKKYRSYTGPHRECIMRADTAYLSKPAAERKFIKRPAEFDTLHYGSDPNPYWGFIKQEAIKSCTCGLYVNGRLTQSRSRMIYHTSRIIPLRPADEWKPTSSSKTELSVHDIGKLIPHIGARAFIKVTAEDLTSVVNPKPIATPRHLRHFSEVSGMSVGVLTGAASFNPRVESVRRTST